MFAVRLGAGRSGANSAAPWRVAGGPRPRHPAPAIELGYIALIAAFAALLGTALATITTTNRATPTLAPVLTGAPTHKATINAATTGIESVSPTLIHNLGARSALSAAVGRF